MDYIELAIIVVILKLTVKIIIIAIRNIIDSLIELLEFWHEIKKL